MNNRKPRTAYRKRPIVNIDYNGRMILYIRRGKGKRLTLKQAISLMKRLKQCISFAKEVL